MKTILKTTNLQSIIYLLILLNPIIGLTQDENIIYELKDHDEAVNTIAFSNDNSFLYSGSEDKQIIKWDLATGEVVIKVEGHYRGVRQITCLHDNVTIFSAGDRAVKAWNNLLEKQDEVWQHPTDVWSFDLDPQNKIMITGTFEKKPYIWDLYTDEIIAKPEAHENTVLAVAFSKNGKYFATGSLDKQVYIWNKANMEVEKVGIGHSENIFDLEFTPDDKFLISVSKDKMVKVWNVETGGHYRTLSGHTDAVMCVSIHPKYQRFFLTGSIDGSIRLWDLKEGNCIYTFIDHKGPVNDVSFSNDGKMFASASNDQSILVWKFSPGLIAEYYFPDELEKEWEDNAIFSPKRKNENRSEYQERTERAKSKKEEIYIKYFNQLLKADN